MKINKKHVISLVLALAMLLSCMPGVALVTNAAAQYDKPEGRSIAVGYDDYVGADWAEALLATLPKTATIGGQGEYAITWPAATEIKEIVNPDEVGFYFIPGTVDGVANAVTVTIQVQEKVSVVSESFEYAYQSELRGAWTTAGILYHKGTPANTGSYAAQCKSPSSSKLTSLIEQQVVTAKAHAAAMRQEGGGQYYVSMQVRDYTYTSSSTTETAHTDDLYVYLEMSYTLDAEAKGTEYIKIMDESGENAVSSNKVKLNSDTYQETGMVVNLTGEEQGIKTTLQITSDTEFISQYVLADDLEMIPLNVALDEEPATIAGVADTLTPIAIVKNYDDYVDGDWQTKRGLPGEVTVTGSDSDSATAEVIWDYTPLGDLSVAGRYVLTGKLVCADYVNPSNVTVEQVVYIREKTNLLTNGYFENPVTTSEWLYNYGATTVEYPADSGNKVYKPRSTNSTTGKALIYQANAVQAPLAAAVKAAGHGQYYLGVDLMSVPYSASYSAREDISVKFLFKLDGTTSWSTEYSDGGVSTEDWTTLSKVFDITEDYEKIRTDLNVKADTGYWALYVDNFELIALKVELTETPALPIKYASVDLSNSLDMNFYIDETVLADVASAKIVHTYADGTTDEQVKALSDISVDGEGESYITYNDIAAKEMGDSITVTLYNSEGTAIAVWMDSMVDYLARISDQISGDLYTDLQNYGAAAQNYFGYNTTQLVNSNVTTSIRDITPTKNSNGPAEWTGSTLTLESNILMEVFFAKNALTGDETATVTYTTHAGTPVSKEVSLVLDDYYDEWKVQIDGLAIADVSTVVTVTVGGFTVTDSMESYVARQLEKGETDDIYKAILAVGASAKAYFESL